MKHHTQQSTVFFNASEVIGICVIHLFYFHFSLVPRPYFIMKVGGGGGGGGGGEGGKYGPGSGRQCSSVPALGYYQETWQSYTVVILSVNGAVQEKTGLM